MLIFNDKYTWEGPSTIDDTSLWLLSCRLWIIDLNRSSPDIIHMKPFIVVAMDTSPGPRRKICAETLGKQIYRDFNLDIKRTLWVEYDPDLQDKLVVADMVPNYHDGMEMIYSIRWRKLRESEFTVLCSYIPELKS